VKHLKDKNILVTGGAGFIGSNFVEYLVEKHDASITVVDKLTYAGSKEKLSDVLEEIEFVKADISDNKKMRPLLEEAHIVVNFAAESHVDRSIESGDPFVHSNVQGAQNLMKLANNNSVEKFIQISTDEVYGSIEEGKAKEGDKLDPSSPYSASKAAADMFANSYRVTHDLPICIVRPVNNFGPKQNPEKLIPKFIKKAKNDEKLPLYGDGSNVRDWLYVKDNCRAIEKVIRKGKAGEIYNVGADQFKTNLEVTKKILELLGKPEDLIEFVEDRKGHDQRYAVDSTKIRELGWRPEIKFEEGLEELLNSEEY
jgi:dTDP-glucose 4,6-dehydratase